MDTAEDLAKLNDQLQAKNYALAQALSRASEELTKAKSQLEQFTKPPLTFATVLRLDRFTTDDRGVQHASAEVLAAHRRIIVPVAASVNAARLSAGMTVLLDENMVIVSTGTSERCGAVRQVEELLDDGRIIIADAAGNRYVVERSHDMQHTHLTRSDRVMLDSSDHFVTRVLPREHTDDLVLEEIPDVNFEDIGGLDEQIATIQDAVQLPFTHRDLFTRFDLKPPKGVLLYGPPGNGKTLIAKAVASSLTQGTEHKGVFLSVKGPELLNKYVGESERLIRLIFDRARERASDGRPVILFIDEMDALLRTRGSGVSSDVETTIVPQFLAELDGVEQLDNVIVIGASNRIDMIDPAVLRPGRLDVKIRVNRPDREQAHKIVSHYLTDALPIEAPYDAHELITMLVEDVYSPQRVIAQICDESGTWSHLYFSDVVSGAMLKNMVDRIKTKAVKSSLDHDGVIEISPAIVYAAVEDEYEAADATLCDVDLAQWAKINGIEKENITQIRPMKSNADGHSVGEE